MDDGNMGSNDACVYPQCTHNVCGDGLVNVGVEQCDDMNDIDNDQCDNMCMAN
jgi:cysteine-rich repeat protein